MSEESFPTHIELMWPTILALKSLGGSGNIEEIFDTLVKLQNYSEQMQKVPSSDGRRSLLEYRASWARTYLKNLGMLENTGRGVWALTDSGESASEEKISLALKADINAAKANKKKIEVRDSGTDVIKLTWQDKLLGVIVSMKPDAFERLCQRLLREAGFNKVEVTGKSGDGGIDGHGILKLNLLSFHVYFQCKRYQGSVGAGAVRDFRGAMAGRGDKGLIITSGYFTPDARKEASRDGAPAIDLIDGDELCELLKQYSLGVSTALVEEVSIANEWFESI